MRLLQVVWNLLSNAIKFTNPGGHIAVRLEEDGGEARLSVVDDGAGISAEFAPHVFELYRQADETGGHHRGLGIGLAIVAQIVKAHGGTVSVESPGLGHGSTFTVALPLFATADEEPAGSGRRAGSARRADVRTAEPNQNEESS